MRYTSQGTPCSHHFYRNLKALIIEQKIMHTKRKTNLKNNLK